MLQLDIFALNFFFGTPPVRANHTDNSLKNKPVSRVLFCTWVCDLHPYFTSKIEA